MQALTDITVQDLKTIISVWIFFLKIQNFVFILLLYIKTYIEV